MSFFNEEKKYGNLRQVSYYPHEVARIVNPKQYTLYIKNHVYPIDIYSSIDEKTGFDITVMIFLKSESNEVYEKWKNHELS